MNSKKPQFKGISVQIHVSWNIYKLEEVQINAYYVISVCDLGHADVHF